MKEASIEVNGTRYFINEDEYKEMVKFYEERRNKFHQHLVEYFNSLRKYGKE